MWTKHLASGFVLGLLLAPVAPLPASAAGEDAAAWIGRHCTRLGCSGPARSPAATLAAFAAVAAGGVWWSRRRERD